MANILEENILFKITTEGNDKAESEINDLKKAYEAVAAAAKKALEEAEEATKKAAKATKEQNESTKSQADELKKLIREYKLFGTSINDVSKRFEKFQKEFKKSVTTAIDNNKALKAYRASIDRASKAIEKKRKESKGLNIVMTASELLFSKLGKGGRAVATVVGSTMVKAFKALKVALISTGIGAVVALFGALVTKVSQSTKFIETFERVTNAVGVVVETLANKLILLGGVASELVNGEIGFSEAIAKVREGLKGLDKELNDNIKTRDALTIRAQALIKAERELRVEQSKRRAEIEKLRIVADDESKSFEERQNAIKRAIRLESELEERRVALAQENLDIVRARLKADSDNVNLINEEAEAEIALSEIVEDSNSKRAADILTLQGLRKDQDAERKKSVEDEIKRLAELSAQYQKAERILEDLRNESIESISDRVRAILQTEADRAISDFEGTEAQIKEFAKFVNDELQAAFSALDFREANPLFEPTDLLGLDDKLIEEARVEAKQVADNLGNFADGLVKDTLKRFEAGEFEGSTPFDAILGELTSPEFKKQLADTSSDIVGVYQQINNARLEGIDEALSKQKDLVSSLKEEEDTNVDVLNSEVERLERIEQARAEAVEKQRKLANIQLAINTALSVSEAIKAALAIIGSNPLIGVLQLAGAAAAVFGFISQVQNQTNSIPTFHTGTDDAQPTGSSRTDSTKKPLKSNEFYAKLEKGEIITKAKDGAQIRALGYGASDFLTLAKAAKASNFTVSRSHAPSNFTKSDKRLESIERTNREIAKKLDTTNKYLRDSDTEMNITNQGIYLASKRYLGSSSNRLRRRKRK